MAMGDGCLGQLVHLDHLLYYGFTLCKLSHHNYFKLYSCENKATEKEGGPGTHLR